MTRRLAVGISTCPNDTFAFHALLAGEVGALGQAGSGGLELAFELRDVEELNEGMLAGRYDVAKVSFHAALALGERVTILPSGAALGFGVGPVLLAAPGRGRPDDAVAPGDAGRPRRPRVLCPGRWTTATLLWRLFHPEPVELEQRVFSDILPALESGAADFGVCIHEARFTWRAHGLELVEDLGERWERATGAALPLGGIVARTDLGPEVLAEVAGLVRRSLDWGLAHRAACLPTMRRHAQEQADDVLWAHVETYVNAWTRELGDEGRRALAALEARARAAGLEGLRGLPPVLPPVLAPPPSATEERA